MPDDARQPGAVAESRDRRSVSVSSFLLSTYGLFVITFGTGAAMVAASWWLPENLLHNALIVLLTLSFGVSFLALLVTRLTRIYAGHYFWLESILALLGLAGVLVAFALVHMKLGIIDTTTSSGGTTHEFGTCLYVSVVTFTTLGFGDFVPRGQGQIIASIEAFIGYTVLALVASTAAGLIQTAGQRASYGERSAAAKGFRSDLLGPQSGDKPMSSNK